MRHITLPEIGTASAWRKAARTCLATGVHPHTVAWGDAKTPNNLFDGLSLSEVRARIKVPRSFVLLADTVCWHKDPERFARLYAFLWRLKDAPHLITDRGDRDLARLRLMEKAVYRCQHKMKAFVRFREIGKPDDARRCFAAWFEPTHHTVEPTAPFFAHRFADMDWRIVTPEKAAIFTSGELSFATGQSKPSLSEDATEALWVTYFRNIFNPARLNVRSMQSEMPKKYWRNLPETAAIGELVASAPERVRSMAETLPTSRSTRVDKVQKQLHAYRSAWSGPADALPTAIHSCTRCPLHTMATQAVPGEGPPNAPLMIVGEQPGDREDLAGRPFVGPAGELFDQIAEKAGLQRSKAFMTNAVKHFKFKVRGKRRLHQRPNSDEIDHCRWWLEAERTMVRPRLILALGATAAEALTGSGKNILQRRGTVERIADGTPVLLTVHPSYLLRLSDPTTKAAQSSNFQEDLTRAWNMIAAPPS